MLQQEQRVLKQSVGTIHKNNWNLHDKSERLLDWDNLKS